MVQFPKKKQYENNLVLGQDAEYEILNPYTLQLGNAIGLNNIVKAICRCLCCPNFGFGLN